MTRDELLRLIDQAAAEGWKTLDLSGQELTEIPPEIGQSTSIASLDLHANYLNRLPPEIGQLQSLAIATRCGQTLPKKLRSWSKHFEIDHPAFPP